MTIAGFYLSAEGVVLGADSTASTVTADGLHYFNYNQKIFQVGEGSTLGLLTWGLGAFGTRSIRTLVADLADSLRAQPVATLQEVAERWVDTAWPIYEAEPLVLHARALSQKPPHDPANQASRTKEEQEQYENLLQGLGCGFCLGGHVLPGREPAAAYVQFDPVAVGQPAPTVRTEPGVYGWWGAPIMIQRLLYGADPRVFGAIKASGHWNGTDLELQALLEQFQLMPPAVFPIRDAVDYVHSCIHSTIKGMKFSSFSQICGGPIELAVITSDRSFRWVRHKPWDAAITDGESHGN
jgi:hypothetical protein